MMGLKEVSNNHRITFGVSMIICAVAILFRGTETIDVVGAILAFFIGFSSIVPMFFPDRW